MDGGGLGGFDGPLIRFTGADGTVAVDTPGNKAFVRESDFLFDLLLSGLPSKNTHTADGRHVVALTNDRILCRDFEDAVSWVNDGTLPDSGKSFGGMLDVLNWLQIGTGHFDALAKGLLEARADAAAVARVAIDMMHSLPANSAEVEKMARLVLPRFTYRQLDEMASVAQAVTECLDDDNTLTRFRFAVHTSVRLSTVLEWLFNTSIDTRTAANLALVIAPPVLVARVVHAKGFLDEAAYKSIITRNLDRVRLPDLAALRCFTSFTDANFQHVRVIVDDGGDGDNYHVSVRARENSARKEGTVYFNPGCSIWGDGMDNESRFQSVSQDASHSFLLIDHGTTFVEMGQSRQSGAYRASLSKRYFSNPAFFNEPPQRNALADKQYYFLSMPMREQNTDCRLVRDPDTTTPWQRVAPAEATCGIKFRMVRIIL